MNDPRILVPLIVAAAVVAIFFILRKRITGFKGRFTKSGVDLDVKAPETDIAPSTGVDISGAKFKDQNKFAAGDEARVRARNMQAGSGNEFRFGAGGEPRADQSNK